MKKSFILVCLFALVFILSAIGAEYVTDGTFEKEDVGTSAKMTDDFAYDWGISIINGEGKVEEEEGNKFLSVTGFSEFYSFDPIEGPYTFSLDLKLKSYGDVNVFVRAGRNEPEIFPFYEWDWYKEKGGSEGESSTGGPGLLVSLRKDAVRVRVKNMREDSENERISSVYHDFPIEDENYALNKFVNIKFVDDGAKIEVFINDKLLCTAKMSNEGVYEGDSPPVDFTYFKTLLLEDSDGNEVLNIDDARLVSINNVAFGARSHPFSVDNVTIAYEVEETPTKEPAEVTNSPSPEATPEVEEKLVIEKKANYYYLFLLLIPLVIVIAVVVIKGRKRG